MSQDKLYDYGNLQKSVKTLAVVSAVEMAVAVVFLFYPNGRLYLGPVNTETTGYFFGRLMCFLQAGEAVLLSWFLRNLTGSLNDRTDADLARGLEELQRVIRFALDMLRTGLFMFPMLAAAEWISYGTFHCAWGVLIGVVFHLVYETVGLRPVRRSLEALRSGPLASVWDMPRTYRFDPEQMAELRKMAKTLMVLVGIIFAIAVFGDTFLDFIGIRRVGFWGIVLTGRSSYEIYLFFFFNSIATRDKTPEMQYRGLRRIQLAGRYDYPAVVILFLCYSGLELLCFGGAVQLLGVLLVLGITAVYYHFWSRFREKLDLVIASAC